MLTIEQANNDDLTTILNWTIQLHQHEDDGKLKSHIEFETHLSKWLKLEINNPNCLYLIGKIGGIPVGFIGAASIINDNGFLENPIKGVIQLLWVEPKHRQKHVALELVEEIEHCFREMGIHYVECTYTTSNQLAKSFWSKQGYIENSTTARKFIIEN